MSEAACLRGHSRYNRGAGPERPVPKEQERNR
jgi:hypothetical protein